MLDMTTSQHTLVDQETPDQNQPVAPMAIWLEGEGKSLATALTELGEALDTLQTAVEALEDRVTALEA